ncbi:50S ribosomal protein L5 [archaeon]|nr:MAG: 50S ribosomal protein L5 [archaeon]
MKEIKIEKVTLNIGCAGDQKKIEKASRLLQLLTEQKPVVTKSKTRSTFGISIGKPVGTMVTLRRQKAADFLKRVLQSTGNKLSASQLDSQGNLNIGIKEYIDLPGIKYVHDIGMLGLDVAVTLKRAGYRVKLRHVQKGNISKKHSINKVDAVEWLKGQGVKIE